MFLHDVKKPKSFEDLRTVDALAVNYEGTHKITKNLGMGKVLKRDELSLRWMYNDTEKAVMFNLHAPQKK